MRHPTKNQVRGDAKHRRGFSFNACNQMMNAGIFREIITKTTIALQSLTQVKALHRETPSHTLKCIISFGSLDSLLGLHH